MVLAANYERFESSVVLMSFNLLETSTYGFDRIATTRFRNASLPWS